MKKKGDLSIGIIIAAAVGVLVLVVMGAIFINQMKGTTDDIKTDCSRLGGILYNKDNGGTKILKDTNGQIIGCNETTHIAKYDKLDSTNTKIEEICCANLG